MAVADAVIARGMSQRIKRAIPAIQQNFVKQNALLYLVEKRGQIKWKGYHTEFEWYIRRTTGTKPEWGGGDLGIRTFEEIKPVNRVHLPYCWIEKTYGVSDRSIEANRHAGGAQKVYDILKENLIIAKTNLYDALIPAMWTGGADTVTGGNGGEEPIGLDKVIGRAYQSTHDCEVDAGGYYANQILNTSAVTSTYAALKTGWDDIHWAPICFNLQETPGVTDGSAVWKTDCVKALAYLADQMEVTAKFSGTGKPIKPTHAFMAGAAYSAVKNLFTVSQYTYNIPVGSKELTVGDFPNLVVDSLVCVKDTEVPADKNSIPRVLGIDIKNYHVCTTHTKAEGLIINEFDTTNPLVSGAIGVLKSNLGYLVASPAVVGCIVGAD